MTNKTNFIGDMISIVIPTYKRPAGIARALNSVVSESVANMQVEIIIADNDPAASARDYITTYAETSPAKITYVHVPQPGVSNARNGALDVARGRYILFLDDDMEAVHPWAQTLYDTAQRFDAALVFGPVDAVMPEQDNPFYDYMKPLFCRKNQGEDGLIPRGIATGNSLIDRVAATLPTPAFSLELNQTGGEDDALFRCLEEQDIKIAWTNKAVTYEHVPAERATLRYVWRRNFAFGQAPTKEAADNGLRGLPHIVKWMFVGLAQIGIYGGKWTISKLLGRPRAVHHWGRLAQGFGKVFWTDKLSPKLYGV